MEVIVVGCFKTEQPRPKNELKKVILLNLLMCFVAGKKYKYSQIQSLIELVIPR